MPQSKFGIAIHGGAGNLDTELMTAEKELQYKTALQAALDVGYTVLAKNGTAVDAVEQAVKSLEDCPLFNAGRGSVFNSKGGHEMDASIMQGSDLAAGAVGLVKNVRNPISLARAVMEKSNHVFICGEGAEEFAKNNNLDFAGDNYFFDEFRYRQWMNVKEGKGEKKFGTVGAVALDINGNLAAATSTGGMTGKTPGRIGNSPIIGAGTYANNNTCAVSCTGHGEPFIKSVVAYDISALMEYRNLSLLQACNEVVMNKLVRIGGAGGIIAIDKRGNMEMIFNTARMYRAMKSSDGEMLLALY